MKLAPFPRDPERRVTLIVLVQNILWLLLALAILPRAGHILYDEAFFYDRSVAVFHDWDFPAIGPFISETNPAAYTPGGGLYLLLSPAFLFTLDPRAGTAWIVLLTVAGNLVLDRALTVARYPWRLRLIIGTVLVWSEWHARSSDRIWNVSLFWFLSLVVLSCCLRIAHRAGNQGAAWMGLGFALAFAFQVHLGAVLLAAVSVVFVVAVRRKTLEFRYLALGAGCFILMYVPYLVADGLRGWSNLHNMRQGIHDNPRQWQMLARAGIAPFRYAANLSIQFDDARFPISGYPWWGKLHVLAAMIVVGFGLLNRSALRYLVIGLIPFIVIYFFFSRRDMHDHYLSSIYTTSLIGFALGLDYLAERLSLKNSSLYILMGIWSVFGTVQWLQHFTGQLSSSEISADSRLHAVAVAAQEGEIYPLKPPTHEASLTGENFVYYVLTKRLHGFEPRFRDERTGEIWGIGLGSASHPGERSLSQGSYYYPVTVRTDLKSSPVLLK